MIGERKKKVGVFLVGSRKSGTTSLANFLAKHSDISLSSIKEPNYFNGAINHSLDKYHSLFDWSKKLQLEASTSYTANLNHKINISKQIQKYNPQAKIIYVVRDPLERIISHYRMSYERGDIDISLNEALSSHSLLLDCSRYYSHIYKYILSFGRKNVLILNSENLNEHQTEKDLFKFLKLTRPFTERISKDNAADTDLRMPRSIDRILNNKIYLLVKSIMPNSIIAKVKSIYFHSRNKKMSTELNDKSKNLLKTELLSEMNHLQKTITFDISPWIKKIKSL